MEWLLWLKDKWQAVLGIADYHYFGVVAQRQFFGGFDALPFEELRADSLRDDFLKVGDALRFDALAFGFLLFLLQNETHAQGFLFGLLFGFDGALQHAGQLNV